MKTYDFGIGWVYSKDKEFVKLLKKELKKRKHSFYEITYNNADSAIKSIEKGELHFRVYMDLSSFENPIFMVISKELHSKGSIVINNHPSIIAAYNKTKLHKLFEKNNLPVRKTFIINPNKNNKEYLKKVVKTLKAPFVLSPAVTSLEGGIKLNAKSVNNINNFIEDYPAETCLAHEYVVPKVIQNKVALFRIIYSCGKIFYNWWDPQNKFYKEFESSKQEKSIQNKLEGYMKKIAKLTGLRLFSTEFVIRENGKYVIIDYANNPIDLSLQDNEMDGLPKKILIGIVVSITNILKNLILFKKTKYL